MSEPATFCTQCGKRQSAEPREQQVVEQGVIYLITRQNTWCGYCTRTAFEEMIRPHKGLIRMEGRGIVVNWKVYTCSGDHNTMLYAAGIITDDSDKGGWYNPVRTHDGKILTANGKPLFFVRESDGETWEDIIFSDKKTH